MAKKKNVLFVLADDQRFNTIHALGNPDVITPTLDALIARGTTFTQAHIPCGTSGAVCMPSRAMLNTGRTLFHLEGEGQNIPPEHTMMPETFKNNGYDCFGTGKWHNGPPAFTRGFTGGENVFFGGMWDHWNVPTCHYDETGEYDNVIDFVMDFFNHNITTKMNCDKFNPGKHSSELLSDTAIDYLKNREGDDPFYLYLSYLAPHDPRTMPEKFKNMYDPAQITLPENCAAEHPFLFGVETIRDETLCPYPRTEASLKKELAEYYGMITHLDHELGRVLAELEAQHLLEDTIVLFAADNGLAIGSHALMGKQNHYEESVRVPLIFAGPDIAAGKQVDQQVYLLDIFPTLCEMTGLAIPASVEGKSFYPMFADAQYVTRDSLYFAYNDMLRSVKQDGFKLIEYCNTATETQLFDVAHDPCEMHNLAAAQPEKVAELRALLQEYRASWEDGGHQYSASYWDAYDAKIAAQG